MTIKFSGEIFKDYRMIELAENKGTLYFGKPTFTKKISQEKDSVYLYFKGKIPTFIALKSTMMVEADEVMVITPPKEVLKEILVEKLVQSFEKNELKVKKDAGIPEENLTKIAKEVGDYQKIIFTLLQNFNYTTEKIKKKPMKAQHRWNKEVAKILFFIDYNGAKGKVTWAKRNELMLKKGAIMTTEVPLNKDGSIGYSVRFSEKIREENQDKFNGNTTTEDIIFKSVNELGMFLYYGNTNGWLVLKDEQGKTLDEYTVVE